MAAMLNEKTTPSILLLDSPLHTTLRSLVGSAFTPRSIELFEPRIRELARMLVHAIVEKENSDVVIVEIRLAPAAKIKGMP